MYRIADRFIAGCRLPVKVFKHYTITEGIRRCRTKNVPVPILWPAAVFPVGEFLPPFFVLLVLIVNKRWEKMR